MVGPITLILLVLLIGAVITLLTRTREQARVVALISSGIGLLIAIKMYLTYVGGAGMQFTESVSWIPSLGIGYNVGVDGIGLPMVILATLISFLCVIYAWGEGNRPNQFFGLVLLMDMALVGVFASLDFFLFYIFWELTLIPMFFLIGIWGGPRKHYAAIKFLIYTHVASVAMMLAIFAMYYFNGAATGTYTFDMVYLLDAYSKGVVSISPLWINLILGGMLFGFMVKMPAVPFHTWLPDAHVEAPTVGSILLAAVLLKMGGYGLFRVIIPLMANPDASTVFVLVIAIFGVVSILFSTFVALAQKDLKKLVAYSSIGHMGYISLGVAGAVAFGASEVPRILAETGAMYQMFSHGIITAVLFGSVGVIQHATGTRIIDDLGGLTKHMPKLAFIMLAGFLASLGLPGMSGFVAEFAILTGSFSQIPIFVLLAMFGIVFVAAYHLWAIQRALFGPYNEHLGDIHDIAIYELIPLAILVALIIVLGTPNPICSHLFAEVMQPTATHILSMLPQGGLL
ncbi:MAG: complex I subunit 4 family protein [Candidatus Syntropharchaeales archaeon]